MKWQRPLQVSQYWCDNWFYPGTKDVIPDGDECCFNHAIGLPTRGRHPDGSPVRHPIYDYQKLIIEMLIKFRLLWILKAPKLGITEFFLRWILFKAVSDPGWFSGQVMMTAGMNQTTAARFIERMKQLCDNPFNPIEYPKKREKGTDKYNTRNEFYINDLNIRAYPANNIDAIRSQPDPKLILVDEAAFFRMKDTERVKDAAEHYIGNTDPYTVFVSTAGEAPIGVMYEIGEDENSKYQKLWLTDPDKYGLPKHRDSGTSIYDPITIESLRKEPSFRRNYLGEWGSGSGNVFNYADIEKIVEKYTIPDPHIYESALAVDPGFGASRFAILGGIYRDRVLYTAYEHQYERTNIPKALAEVVMCMAHGYQKLLVDSNNPGIINTLRDAHHLNPIPVGFKDPGTGTVSHVRDRADPPELTMVEKLQRMMEAGRLRIHPAHRHLLEDLRAIRYDDRGRLDKKAVSFDMGDCLRMLANYFYAYDSAGIVINQRGGE